MGIVRVLLLIVGILVVLVGLLGAFAGNSFLEAANGLADSEGFINSETLRLQRDSFAIVTTPGNIQLTDDARGIVGAKNIAGVRVRATSADPSRPVFIGIADGVDLRNYLEGVRYDELITVSMQGSVTDYTPRQGEKTPASPTAQSFWVASAHGRGTQTLIWPGEAGWYSLVLMNEDGSSGVDVRASLDIKVPIVSTVASWLLYGSIGITIIGAAMVFFSLWRR